MEARYTLLNRKHEGIAEFPSYKQAEQASRKINGSYIRFNQEAINQTPLSTVKITIEKTFAPGLNHTASPHPWNRAVANVRAIRADGFTLQAKS